MEEQKENSIKKENPFINLIANIFLPVVILNKSELFPTDQKSLIALCVALSFPIGYGLWDWFKNSRKNYLSLLGVVNTLITGVFAISKLSGDWFAIKEAAFPAVLGLAVYISSYVKKPLLKTMLVASGLIKYDKIEEGAKMTTSLKDLEKVFIKCNSLFSLSFFVSAVLNFFLALYIFSPLPTTMSDEAKSIALNEQISQMTWMGLLVIGLPMFVFLGITFFVFFKDLKRVTGLNDDDILTT